MEKPRVAIVTGAGSGIGKAAAGALLRAGWCVVYTGRNLDRLCDAITAEGANEDRARAVAADVSEPDAVEALFAQTVDAFGRVDLLFNNAGMGASAAPVDEISIDDWNRVVAVNLTGAFLCARAAFGQMRQQEPGGGRIINNGSISAHAPRPGSVPYTATKHAITGLTKTLALDGRPFDITCGQIDIGNAATDLTARMPGGVAQADGSIRPEPVIDVQVVADAVVHMASLPLDANVLFMTVMAAKMPFVGRG